MEIMATSKNYGKKKVRITSGIFWTLMGKNPIMEKSDAGAACLSWTFFFSIILLVTILNIVITINIQYIYIYYIYYILNIMLKSQPRNSFQTSTRFLCTAATYRELMPASMDWYSSSQAQDSQRQGDPPLPRYCSILSRFKNLKKN